MKNNLIHQYTLKDVIALRGDESHDNDFYVFTKKNNGGKPDVHHPSRSDFYTLLLITRGKIKVKLNLIDYEIEKNSILFLPPDITFQFIDFGEDLLYYGVAFTPVFLTGLGLNKMYLDNLNFLSSLHSPHLPVKHADSNILCSSLDTLYKRSLAENNYPFRSEIILHLFTAFLYELAAIYKNNHGDEETKLTRGEDIAIQFLKLLPAHFKEERSVKWYAGHLFVTPKYLSQTVKDATGKTAGHFIDEMVLLEAKVLLNNASLSVAQVAEELHFSDQFFFSKFFKRMAGATPTDYRKRS